MSTHKKETMLHEVLAVEADAAGVAKRIATETIHTFKEKAIHFTAATRTLELFNGSDEVAKAAAEKAEAQYLEMVTTVNAKLEYTLKQITPYYDVVLQKEATNQDAVADLITSDGTVIGSNLPATFLLGLETKLKQLREIYEVIPTLAPGVKWEKDAAQGKGVYRQAIPSVVAKTAKTWQHKVLVQATDKHPANIEKWEETINIGAYTKESWSSALTPTEKSELLGRIDDLIRSAKEARQRANSTPIRKVEISKALVSFLHPNGF